MDANAAGSTDDPVILKRRIKELEDELAAMKRKACKTIKRRAAEAREAKEAEASRALYRRRLHKIPGETESERKWQERCWKLPQHGGYTPEFLEAEGMEWDEASNEFRKKQRGVSLGV